MEKRESEAQVAQDEKNKSANSVADYLASTKRKRKRFVLFAAGENFNEPMKREISKWIKEQFPNLGFALIDKPDDLKKHTGKLVALLIINDQFVEMEHLMPALLDLKAKKHQQGCPLLFLTHDSKQLIDAYHEHLNAYQETDDYIDISSANFQTITHRIKNGVEQMNRRKSRRYAVNLPVTLKSLDSKSPQHARIVDLSIHGAMIQKTQDGVFRNQEQIVLCFPTAKKLIYKYGEVFHIAGRVKRVLISGQIAGVNFEHLNETQISLLSRLLVEKVGEKMQRGFK